MLTPQNVGIKKYIYVFLNADILWGSLAQIILLDQGFHMNNSCIRLNLLSLLMRNVFHDDS